MKGESETKKRLIDELAKIRQRVAELEVAEAERKRAEERLERLNAVLSAIRNVNQLIRTEKERNPLLQGACDRLIETRGYHNVWIAVLDKSNKLQSYAESGLGEDFLPIVKLLKRGDLTDCARKALAQSDVVVTEDPPSACADCPLSGKYAGRGRITVPLKHQGEVYGLISVSIPGDLVEDEEEQALFHEVACDIAFALRAIEVEDKRKRAERVVQEAREYAESIVATVREPLVALDAALRVVSLNRSFCQTFKVTPEETVGQLIYDLGNRQWDIPKFRKLLEEILPENTTFEDFELEHDFESIGRRTMMLNARRIYREANKTQMILLAIEDVTERKRAEETAEERTKELRDAQEQLVRKKKLAVLGQLAGGVGHELRNPLGAIKNAAYFLNMVVEEPDPEVKETLEIIEKEVATSERIIGSLLGFARPQPPTRRKTNINEVVEEALSRAAVPERVQVVCKFEEALPPILADPDQLGQVFGNTILNAIQAMPEGGELVIRSEAPGSDWVSVFFTDTGEGIPKENLAKLFEPLFTTKARGIGLGLPIIKTLVEGHGGAIEVQSEVGQGATFTVRLPVGGREEK
ncbi:GAF domain-containing protein [bacterium]|nr:GAF domain-containing protein [bacterium]